VAWARRRLKGGKLGPVPKKVTDAVAVGELVRVRVVKAPPAPAPLELQLDQEPEAEAAFVLLDAKERHVLALVGGYDMGRSAFNRATQARRQPGSAFKPFVYGAALESHRFTPSSVVNDAPETVRDEATGKTWKPQNFERAVFEGPMTLRAALTRSKNTVSVRLLEALGPQAAIDFARRAGIRSPLPENLTLALGTGEVGVLELASAYATLQAGGRWAEPLMLLGVRDAQGKVLEAHVPSFEQRIDPAVAYLTTSLMQSVVEEGTAVAVKELGRPAAGKTGTASESRDAWFSGYTAHHVGTAWVGFDDHSPLGSGETGGRAALPIWLQALREAERPLPVGDFEVPKGVLSVHVDPATGLLAPEGSGREELFLEGTQPTDEAPPTGTVAPENFFLEDGR
jgi:penicillin-binding protein 1A